MEYVAYNYFETPKDEALDLIASAFVRPDFEISNAGKNDPPKKFKGGVNELSALIKDSTDLTNFTFLKSRDKKIEVTIEIHNDPRWEYSTFSISGPIRIAVEEFCLSLNSAVNSYLCISGTMGLGASQEWSFLYKNSACPQSILEQVSNA
ncbi:MAG: hypothetical protein WBG74_10875 [Shewanella sp.]|uniref:hypothetical protein n=1 Tax=Shewanella sp. TaxID=50422 RepID=UPI0035689A50